MSSPQSDEVANSPPSESIEGANAPEKALTLNENVVAASTPESDRDGSPAADIPEDLDEESALKVLSATARDQDDLERDISHQASLALMEAEENRDTSTLSKMTAVATFHLRTG